MRRDATAFYAEAADSERMRSVVERRLRAPSCSPIEVAACHVTFARQGKNRSLFQYDVILRDPEHGKVFREVVSGVGYAGNRTHHAWKRLQRLQPEEPSNSGWLVRAAYVPELELLLQVFPFDHQMPALEPLLAGPWPPLVAPLLAQFGPGGWRLEEWSAEAVRYRVDLRASVHLTIRASEFVTGRTAARSFHVKTYANPTQAAHTWEAQTRVAAALAAGNAGFAIAPTAAYLPEQQVMAQDELSGPSLTHVMQQAHKAEEGVRRAACAVAGLHQLAVAPPAGRGALERIGPERVRRSAERLRAVRPELSTTITSVEAGILSGLAAAGEAPTAPVHGDLKPDHIIFDEDRVLLLDLDKFGAGDPMLDITNMMGHFRRGGLEMLGRAFVAEYLARVPNAWEQRLRPVYAASLLGEASTVFKTMRTDPLQRAQQMEKAGVVLQEAQAVLAGGRW